jgi:hypothetical protein
MRLCSLETLSAFFFICPLTAALYRPAGHNRHDDWETAAVTPLLMNRPAGHGTSRPSAQYAPDGQGVDVLDVLPVGHTNPSAQTPLHELLRSSGSSPYLPCGQPCCTRTQDVKNHRWPQRHAGHHRA